MKTTIFLVTAIAVSLISAQSENRTRDLLYDFQEFLSLLPMNVLRGIFEDYKTHDKEVRKLVNFYHCEDFKLYVSDIRHCKEYQQLVKYFRSKGFDLYSLLDFLRTVKEMPSMETPCGEQHRTCSGVLGMLQDFSDVIPWEDIRSLSVEKYEDSEAYRTLYDLFQCPQFKQIFCTCRTSPKFLQALEFGRQRGFDLFLGIDFLLRLLNIEMVHC